MWNSEWNTDTDKNKIFEIEDKLKIYKEREKSSECGATAFGSG